MGKISNAWQLAKSSWAVLSKDRALVLIPVISAIVALVAGLIIASPILVMLDGTEDGANNLAAGLIGVVAMVVATWIVVVGEAAVVAGAGQRMDGHEPTVSSSFAVARQRLFRLLEWAVMATVVSIVLDVIKQRFGAIGGLLSWAAGVAFRVMSFLALPVIVFEDVGAIESFKRSSAMLKRTWGEQVSFNFALSLVGFIAFLPGLLLGGALIATGILPLVVVGIAGIVLWAITVFAVTAALSAVFKTALYRYAKGLPVSPEFDTATLSTSITAK